VFAKIQVWKLNFSRFTPRNILQYLDCYFLYDDLKQTEFGPETGFTEIRLQKCHKSFNCTAFISDNKLIFSKHNLSIAKIQVWKLNFSRFTPRNILQYLDCYFLHEPFSNIIFLFINP
jgi:hypothetical protein